MSELLASSPNGVNEELLVRGHPTVRAAIEEFAIEGPQALIVACVASSPLLAGRLGATRARRQIGRC